eukprot:TRINITY_DN332_c0_g1_i4.p1 TRINITY_DN332_c0_g1~~TRINITY_DN332_c0_g1_i4.p1  ORF type:complete len:147 (-),score=13.77 TRINITY_DN332_c0_g1_i4:27-467(-)
MAKVLYVLPVFLCFFFGYTDAGITEQDIADSAYNGALLLSPIPGKPYGVRTHNFDVQKNGAKAMQVDEAGEVYACGRKMCPAIDRSDLVHIGMYFYLTDYMLFNCDPECWSNPVDIMFGSIDPYVDFIQVACPDTSECTYGRLNGT